MKLSEDEVRELKAALRRGESPTEVARRYGVTPRFAQLVKTGERYGPHRRTTKRRDSSGRLTPAKRAKLAELDGQSERQKLEALRANALHDALEAQLRGDTKAALAHLSSAGEAAEQMANLPVSPEEEKVQIVITGGIPPFGCWSCRAPIHPYQADLGGKPDAATAPQLPDEEDEGFSEGVTQP